ncbi:MAG: hypothetical protein KJZ80_16835 [Hyphomicrobiaceae bacterium]|nr:hypothetical protein [Hyphomicrobiaceae bacterium]
MTQRDRQKKGRAVATRATSRSARSEASSPAGAALDALGDLERERNELRTRLAAAEARIELLESQRVEVLNRIDWVIDSIHNVIERGT